MSRTHIHTAGHHGIGSRSVCVGRVCSWAPPRASPAAGRGSHALASAQGCYNPLLESVYNELTASSSPHYSPQVRETSAEDVGSSSCCPASPSATPTTPTGPPLAPSTHLGRPHLGGCWPPPAAVAAAAAAAAAGCGPCGAAAGCPLCPPCAPAGWGCGRRGAGAEGSC